MGGGQNNSAQAAQSAQAAAASEAASANLSKLNASEQEQSYNYLFGAPGSKTGGSLTPMMDPASLNVTNPTGAYKAQYQNATNTLNKGYDAQRGALAQAWANNGTSTSSPSGFQADQMRKLGNSQADAQGNLFTGTVSNQYQDALNNFWNANNIASGQAASARGGAIQGAGNEGTTAGNIYNTAGAWHQGIGGTIAGSALQAGGSVGAAALCPARGAKIKTSHGDVLVELLKKGDAILQSNGAFFKLPKAPMMTRETCVTTRTDFAASTTSRSHSWQLPDGGYIAAAESIDKSVQTVGGRYRVRSVEDAGEQDVFVIPGGGNNTYLCDGIWSLI